jgi:hypothetical protein
MALLAFIALSVAHDVPVELPPPQSAPEAWNVIVESTANIRLLLSENLAREVGAQLANISGALVTLPDFAAGQPDSSTIKQLSGQLLRGEVELLHDSRDGAGEKTPAAFADWEKSLASLEQHYPPAIIQSRVYICPMHPQDRHLNPNERCTICGMALVCRHLPASAAYQRPGEPTMHMSFTSPALVVGQRADVIMHLAKSDGSPVTLDDLVEIHTRKIHLLINDRGLSDYHHVHPDPTEKPGDYRFSFTPSRPGPYRVWADLVPTDSGVQEYDIADLPASTTPLPIQDRQPRYEAVVDGRHFKLSFQTGDAPLVAKKTVLGYVSITDADGRGFAGLEPVMGAFAHLVGFSEDGKSVLHIHPYGRDATGPLDRAGPVFAFKFYAPSGGFLRLYCQVRINGQDVFAPFNLSIAQSSQVQPASGPSSS